jgi:fatty acid desaturase
MTNRQAPNGTNLQLELNRTLGTLDEKYKQKKKFGYSLLFVVRDVALCSVIYWVLGHANYLVYSAFMGTAMVGLWVLGHECGHGAFGDYGWQNDCVGFILHSALLVPYFSWKYSHNKHHKYTNHLLLGETHVPSTKTPHIAIRRIVGDDAFAVFDVVLHLVFGWPMYLLFNSTGGRTQSDLTTKLSNGANKSHFTSTSQVMKPTLKVELSTVGCGMVIGMLMYFDLTRMYAGPYLVVNAWLVLYTWLQHTHPDVPHYGADDFTFLKGALSTIDRPYPYVFDQMHHHIGTTHVLHHLNFSIPHYRAEEYTMAIRQVLGAAYVFDQTPIHKALFRTAMQCRYVESVNGTQYYKS